MQNCFSQEGEDVLLERILQDINYQGSFIDIGALHPTKFSNTYKFYLSGWRGMNIDATPGSSIAFNKTRPADINVESPISDKEEELTFYVFNYPELNTFSEEHVKEWVGKNGVRIIETIQLKTRTINTLLSEHYGPKKAYDLLSIDVEGLDLRILRTLDFMNYQFNFLIVEDTTEISKLDSSDIYSLLTSKGYKLLSKLYYSTIYYFDYTSPNGRNVLSKAGFSGNSKELNMNRWTCQFLNLVNEIIYYVPVREKLIFVDKWAWQIGDEIYGRKVIPFIEKNGEDWGNPATDADAINEIERQQKTGTNYFVLTSASFWWLEYYSGMQAYLQENYECILSNDQLVIFSAKDC